MIQSVQIEAHLRDENGNVIVTDSGYGTTEDGGRTVTIPMGYLPNRDKYRAGDIKITLFNPPVEIGKDPGTGATFVDKTEDPESGMQTISLSLPE